MRWALMLAWLCGCGRIAIDPIADDGAMPDAPPTGPGVFAVAAHVNSSCMILDGALSCWGANANGQLATGDTMDRFARTPIGSERDWIAIAPGETHICGLRAGGDLYCWGGNDNGELGQGDMMERHVPTRVPLARPVVAIDAWSHTCAILDNGELWCWGQNAEGELGQNDSNGAAPIPSPVQVSPGMTWSRVGLGQGHTLAYGAAGLYGTGRNVDSELGLGPTGSPQLRVMTAIDTAAWTTINGAQNSSCGRRADQTIACWGANDFGPLGTGDKLNRDVPTTVGTTEMWRTVDIDTFHSCALAMTNQIYCTGRNVEGQLGTGDFMDRMDWTLSSTFSDWILLSVGRFHTCGMRADHSVWCVGQNTNGQLGVTGTQNRANWLQVL
ncbi:MAG TPA: hypothetical protein VFV99_16080 [Kofleriaceae bacterium]|nr:hypothetical protein [Kofleriaceae bacterium]